MDCGRWPLSVVRHKVGRGLGLSGFWGNMDWTRSAGSLTPLALDSSLLDSVVVVVVGCEWLDVRWCVQEVRQGWLHGFFPGMLDEVRVGQVGLVGKAMLDVLVVRDVQRCLAVDVGLAAVNSEPVVTVNGQGPASEGHEFRVGPARAMELLALRSRKEEWNTNLQVQGHLYQNEPRAIQTSLQTQMNQLQFKWNSTDLFTEVSNTFVIVTAHKQVCANQQIEAVSIFAT